VKRFLFILAALILVLLLIATLAWWWLTGSRSGASFALGQVDARVERLDWRTLNGNLREGLVLDGVVFEQSGLSVGLDRLELAVSIGLLPPFPVTVERLAVVELDVRTPPPDPDAPPSEPFRPGDYSLPLPVAIEQARVDGLTVRSAGDGEPLRIDRIELAGSAFETLDLGRLEIDAPAGSARLSGSAGLAAPWRLDLASQLTTTVDDVDQAAAISLAGPLADLDLGLELSGGLRGTFDAALQGLPDIDALAGRIEGEAALQRWPGVDGRIEAVRIALEGRIADWQGTVQAEPALNGVPLQRLAIDAEGSRRTVRQATVRANLLDGEVVANGRFDASQPPTGRASVTFRQLDFTTLYPDWPDQARVQGRFDAEASDGEVRVSGLEIEAEPTPLRVTGEGRYRLDDQHVSVALDWTDLAWPPITDDTEPLVRSDSGRFEGRGTLDEWQAELGAWLQLPDQPRTRIEVDGSGDRAEARIERGLVRPDDAGQLLIAGRAGLQAPFSAALDLQLERFDPGALVRQLPGRIDGRARLALAPETADLDIESLSGELRGQPVRGGGRITVREYQVTRADVELAVGDNRAVVARPDPSSWNVSVDAPGLSQLWPGLTGTLAAEATIRPPERALDWTLDGSGLMYGGRRAAQLDSRGTVNWGERPAATARLTAEDIDLNPWERLSRIELTLTGDCSQHRLSAFAAGTRATLDLAGGGAFADCGALTDRWTGQLDRLQISETAIGPWQLSRPLGIIRTDQGIRVDAACLWTPGHPGRLCLNGLDAAAEGQARIAFNGVPMDLVLLPLDPAFSIGSELRGLAALEWDGDGPRRIDARLLMNRGEVQLLGVEDTLLTLDSIDLAVQSPEPRVARATLDFRLGGANEITGEVRIPDMHRPAEATVDGRLALSLPRLNGFNRLVPQLDALQGRLDAELRVQGPLLGPELDGEARLSDGRIHHAPLGFDLEAIELTLAADEQGGRLDGAFRAGEGTGRVEGRLASGERGWSGRIGVDGEDLALFDAGWLSLTITPDLSAEFDPDHLALDGILTVNRGRLGFPPGTADRVEPSPDVVVVGADTAEVAEPPRAPRPVRGQVSLVLGDDVRLEAAGMRTRLAGGLDMRWNGEEAIPTASGRIDLVQGAYRAYGQNLDVQRGEVLFTGNPIDNPMLDIAAARQIFGDPVVERAGVQIRGPAQNPDIELYTEPPTSREKALAYVLTGAEFDHAAGQGAFNVGFFVLPEVFVSYGVGLFDTGNVLAARWDFAERWGLKATSGESDTGADLSFIIDR